MPDFARGWRGASVKRVTVGGRLGCWIAGLYAARHMARPFVKWAGGKAKLAPTIVGSMPAGVRRYVEPFVGAGAVFFALDAERPGTRAVLSDANPDLIEAYTVLRDEPGALSEQLGALQAQYLASDGEGRKAAYYAMRSAQPDSPVGRAARFIFLNKTCYNGLFRVNASGGFNVPHGRYKNPRIHDAALIEECSRALQAAEVRVEDFGSVCAEAEPGDFVYLDPPYHPLSATASFTGYTRADFGQADQVRLRDAFEDLSRRGVAAMLSNSDHPFVRGLYAGLGYGVREVTMSRAINSKGTGRAPVGELLVDNFERVGLDRVLSA